MYDRLPLEFDKVMVFGRRKGRLCPELPRATVAIETHGCKLNQADSELLAQELKEAGFTIVGPEAPASVYLLNSCTVTHMADGKARQELRAAHRRYPEAKVVVTGCYAQRAAQELRKIPGVALVVGNTDKGILVQELLRLEGQPDLPCATGTDSTEFLLPYRNRAMVKIQEGCNQVCAYCIVPKVRGRERSVPADRLVSQVRERMSQGYKEVVLTGTQLGSYGHDLPGMSLKRLVERVLAETDVERLRVSSLQPQEIDEGFLSLWRDPRLCPHFHMPLQSGSSKVLGLMRRHYTPDIYARTVALIRERVPRVSITCDVIVGFPGEGEEEFRESYEFCEGMAFAGMHVFPYSSRAGTSAGYFKGQVSAKEKARRSSEMHSLAGKLAMDFRRRCVGEVREVLWELPKEVGGIRLWLGLTGHYLRVCTVNPLDLSNRSTFARITHVAGEALWGKVVE